MILAKALLLSELSLRVFLAAVDVQKINLSHFLQAILRSGGLPSIFHHRCRYPCHLPGFIEGSHNA